MTEPPEAPGGAGVLRRLREAGLLPRKVLGQHFLHDPKLLRALVDEAQVGRLDRAFEVGTGPGTLTRELARAAGEVLTVEVDARMLEFARSELQGFSNVRFHLGDALGRKKALSPQVADELRCLGPFVWVSNLPYGIATTLILAVAEADVPWRRAAVMVQEEVAARLAAGPGEPAYGPAAALLAFWGAARPGRKVPPGAFWPAPRVDSRVIEIRRQDPLGPREAYASYARWVTRLFMARRKQIRSTLVKLLDRHRAEAALDSRGWKPSLRPENLTPQDFLHLAREFPVFSR